MKHKWVWIVWSFSIPLLCYRCQKWPDVQSLPACRETLFLRFKWNCSRMQSSFFTKHAMQACTVLLVRWMCIDLGFSLARKVHKISLWIMIPSLFYYICIYSILHLSTWGKVQTIGKSFHLFKWRLTWLSFTRTTLQLSNNAF